MKSENLAERPAASRTPRDVLVKTHNARLTTQDNDDSAARPVKQPLLEEAYQASTKSIKDLEIVRVRVLSTPPSGS